MKEGGVRRSSDVYRPGDRFKEGQGESQRDSEEKRICVGLFWCLYVEELGRIEKF